MQLPLFPTIRRLFATRVMRLVSMFVFAMCSVTWVAQSVSSIRDNPRVPGSEAASIMAVAEAAERLAAAKVWVATKVLGAEAAVIDAAAAGCLDGGDSDADDCDAEVSALLVALDETHDIKLFFLREFTHLLQPAVGRIPRNRDIAAILRMSSETFRPPDSLVGNQGRTLEA